MKLKAATNWSTKSAGLRLIEIYPHQRQRESDFNKSLVFYSILRFSQHQTSFQQCWYIFLQLAKFKLCQYLKTDNIYLDCFHRWIIRRNSSSTWLHVTFLFLHWKWEGKLEKPPSVQHISLCHKFTGFSSNSHQTHPIKTAFMSDAHLFIFSWLCRLVET